MTWNDTFLELFDRCLASFRGGDEDFTGYYSAQDEEFLGGIGCQPREFFDFVEDHADGGDPSASTALLVAAVRRDYFLTIQKGVVSGKSFSAEDMPSFGEELEGMAYLPRILAKGRAKLRGELHPDLMFDCGGDRKFLKNHGEIPPADFLRNLWAAGDDDAEMAAWIKQQQE